MGFLKNTTSIMTSGGVKQIKTQTGKYDTYAGYGSTNTKIPYFSNASSGVGDDTGLVTVGNDSVNGMSITALKPINLKISFSFASPSGVAIFSGLSLNSNQLTTDFDTITQANRIAITKTQAVASDTVATDAVAFVRMQIGDVVRPHTNGGVPGTTNRCIITFEAVANESTQPSMVVNIAPPSAEKSYYIEAAGNAGQAITANVTDIPFIATLQNNLVWLGDGFVAPISGNYQVFGFIYPNANQSGVYVNAYVNGSIVKEVGYLNGIGGSIPINGKIYLTEGQRLSIRVDASLTLSNTSTVRHHISITRLNGIVAQSFLGNVPKEQVAYIKEIQPSGTNGGTFTSGAWQTRTLNNLSGDTSFVSLLSNVFTLQAGEYDIEASAPAYTVNTHQIGIAQSASSTPDISIGEQTYASQTYNGQNSSTTRTRITVSIPTSYKILHRCTTTSGSNGLGIAAAFGVNEVYTEVKIRKLS